MSQTSLPNALSFFLCFFASNWWSESKLSASRSAPCSISRPSQYAGTSVWVYMSSICCGWQCDGGSLVQGLIDWRAGSHMMGNQGDKMLRWQDVFKISRRHRTGFPSIQRWWCLTNNIHIFFYILETNLPSISHLLLTDNNNITDCPTTINKTLSYVAVCGRSFTFTSRFVNANFPSSHLSFAFSPCLWPSCSIPPVSLFFRVCLFALIVSCQSRCSVEPYLVFPSVTTVGSHSILHIDAQPAGVVA